MTEYDSVRDLAKMLSQLDEIIGAVQKHADLLADLRDQLNDEEQIYVAGLETLRRIAHSMEVRVAANLVNVPTRRSGWVNVYGRLCGRIHDTKAEALSVAAVPGRSAIDTVMIEWEEH